MTPGLVFFDQAGLDRGKIGGRGIGKSAAVRGLERGTSFGEVRAPYVQATSLSCMMMIKVLRKCESCRIKRGTNVAS